MGVERQILKTPDKTSNEEHETVFPKRMIVFILLLSVILLFLLLFKN